MAKAPIKKPAPIVPAPAATCCPACGSQSRTGYHHTQIHEFAGIAPDGRPYRRVIWRRTTCTECGQVRVDKTFENE